MNVFTMNGIVWRVVDVPPSSSYLIDRTGKRTLGTTDPITKTVYLSTILRPGLRERVLIHEIAHCALFSYGLISDIHRMVRQPFWIEAEEFLCNFLVDYGLVIYEKACQVCSETALRDAAIYMDSRLCNLVA